MTPSVALVAYAEPFLDGRRVVVFGDASTDLAEQLVERGARVVHVFDEDAARAGVAAARNRSRNVSYAPLADADVAVRDGAFDVALVPSLAENADRARLVKRVLRALSTRGLALFASPNPDIKLASRRPRDRDLSYYDLYDLVSAEFDEVRMLGQTPFAGYAVVDFANEGEPEISFDSGFVPGGAEEPVWYVAAASHRALDLDPFMVVQLPAGASPRVEQGDAPAAAPPAEREASGSAPELARAESDRAEAIAGRDQARADAIRVATERDTIASKLEEAGARCTAATAERDQARAERDKATAERDRARAERDKATAERDRARAERDKVRAEATASSAIREPAKREGAELRRKYDAESARADELELRVGALTAERDDALQRARSAEGRLERVLDEAERGDAARDVSALEAALVERARELASIREQLKVTEATGHDMVVRLRALSERAATPTAAVDPGPEAAIRARLEADLQAARWTIDELEGLLEERSDPERATLQRQLAEARGELRRRETLLTQLRQADQPQPSLTRENPDPPR